LQAPKPKDTIPNARTGKEGFVFLENVQKHVPQSSTRVAIRTIFLDDVILKHTSIKNKDERIKQVVNLACGCDTRPFRLALPEELNFYEVDLPEIINWKKMHLQDKGILPKCKLYSIAGSLSS
jgi:O-methyltransferase involved in polyketide biosynthesis